MWPANTASWSGLRGRVAEGRHQIEDLIRGKTVKQALGHGRTGRWQRLLDAAAIDHNGLCCDRIDFDRQLTAVDTHRAAGDDCAVVE